MILAQSPLLRGSSQQSDLSTNLDMLLENLPIKNDGRFVFETVLVKLFFIGG